MKHLFFFLISFSLLSGIVKADATITSLTVPSQYLTSGKIKVSNSTSTAVQMTFELTRTAAPYPSTGWSSGKFKYSVVYVDGDSWGTLLAEQQILTTDYNGQPKLNKTINFNIPAGKVGGYVTIKYSYYVDGGGYWTNYNNTSTKYYTAIPPPPVVYTHVDYNFQSGYPSTLPIMGGDRNMVTQGYTYPNNIQVIPIQWDNTKLPNSSNVKLILYKIENYPRKWDRFGFIYYTSVQAVATAYQVVIPNNGTFQFNLGNISLQDPNYDYFFRIESLYGNNNELYFNTGSFTFTNDQTITQPDAFYPIASWSTIANRQENGALASWMYNKLNASNVRIDFYNADGTFNSNVTLSAPNNGFFNAGLPPGEEMIEYENYGNKKYVLKITSLENPNEFGYSAPFWIYID